MTEFKTCHLWQIRITQFTERTVTVGGTTKTNQYQKGSVIGVVSADLERAIAAVRREFPNARLEGVTQGEPIHLMADDPRALAVAAKLLEE